MRTISALTQFSGRSEPISEPEEAKDAVEMVEVEIEEESEEEEKEEAEMVEDEAEEIENEDVQEDDEEQEREPYGVEVEDECEMALLRKTLKDPSYADRKCMPPGGACEEEEVEEFEEKEEEEVPWPYKPGRRPRPRGGWRARLVAKGWVPKSDTRPYWTVPFQHWKPINS